MAPSEDTPLLGGVAVPAPTWRDEVYAFLEGKTPTGAIYEKFTILLIVLNVLAFILGSLFVEDYNCDAAWARRDGGVCGNVCDALWFGNYEDNALEFLNLGSTSVLEIVTVLVFTVDYLLRVHLADLESPKFAGFWGRIRYLPTFYSIVDLASTVPFYVDSFLLRNSNIAASQVCTSMLNVECGSIRLHYDFPPRRLAIYLLYIIVTSPNPHLSILLVPPNVPSLPHDARGGPLRHGSHHV
jgi:hypothetical protein